MDGFLDLGLNWRDSEAYALLLEADRSLFAWEWLRRDAGYRMAARAAGAAGTRGTAERAAHAFGLVRFEPADLPVPFARPLWRSELNPEVLVTEVSADAAVESGFELDWLRHIAHRASDGEMDYLLLTDGLRTIRIDAPAGAFDGRPLSLRLRVDRLILGELTALRRLVALVRTGGFSRSLHPPEARARRWILQLRARDALAAGADLRDIAEVLLGRSPAGRGWRMRDPSLRSQAQRLVRSARALARGDFRKLLVPAGRSERPYWIGRPRGLPSISRGSGMNGAFAKLG